MEFLSIKADFDEAERLLSDIGRKQLPFATAMALNETAEAVESAEQREIRETFDRPTPFTQRALYKRRASKSRLTASVGIKPVQAKYLKLQATGGTRTPSGRALLIPVGARLNKYGNLPKGFVKRQKAKSDVFVASRGNAKTAHLAPGIYKRPRRGKYRAGGSGNKNVGKRKGPQMLLAFEPKATYRARYPFGPVAHRAAQGEFEPAFYKWLERAIRTAK